MNITMKRTKENEEFVFYKFSAQTNVDASGTELPEPKRLFGICKFSKKNGVFELIGETDPILLVPRNPDAQAIKMHLLQIKSEGAEFPEKIEL